MWPRDEKIWAYNPTGITVCLAYKLVLQAKINTASEGYSLESAMEKFGPPCVG